MTRRASSTVAIAMAVCALVACGSKASKTQPYVADKVAERALLAADRAFADDTAERGLDGWVDAFADDGVQLPEGEPLAQGREAIRAVMVRLLGDPTNKLRWEPDSASVSASGDLGYTLGHAVVSKVGPAGGEVVVAKLKYLTVWKRQLDGKWRVAADVGTGDPR